MANEIPLMVGAGFACLLCAAISGCGSEPSDSGGPGSSGPEAASLFREITGEAGLEFAHDAGLDGTYFMPQIMGSGGAVFDYDGDGDLDIYLVNFGGAGKGDDGRRASNRLFSRQADGRYRDRTAESGLGDTALGMGCAVGDIDNDGDPDLLVTNFGPDVLYRNNGDGTFADVTSAAGVGGDRWSMSAAFLDFDGDGWLDLYVAHYVLPQAGKDCRDAAGRPEYCGPLTFPGVPDSLFRNNGDGTFSDASESSGIGGRSGRGLGVLVDDFNLDGRPDVYVANDGEENDLWINLGDGRFENEALMRGVAVNLFGKPEASMGVAVGDIDQDGDADLFMTHLDREKNTLYVNLGDGQFEDRSNASGLADPSLARTGFGTAFFDMDHDGDLDLFVANGKVRRGAAKSGEENSGAETPLAPYAEPNQLFENLGDGKFRDVSRRAGSLTDRAEVSRGVMTADVDEDGDLDILITNTNGPARLYLNQAPKKGHWLKIRAIDPSPAGDAIGATVEVRQAGLTQSRYVTRTFSYLSSHPPVAHFGLVGSEPARVTVTWPDGKREEFDGIPVDQQVELRKGGGAPGGS